MIRTARPRLVRGLACGDSQTKAAVIHLVLDNLWRRQPLRRRTLADWHPGGWSGTGFTFTGVDHARPPSQDWRGRLQQWFPGGHGRC